MYKTVASANAHLTNRSFEDAQRYWAESHGPLVNHQGKIRRYVQHMSLPETLSGPEPRSTQLGVSEFWYDDLTLLGDFSDPKEAATRAAERLDDHQLFDRSTGWPMHPKRASVVGEERIVVDGKTAPEMVKGVFIASKIPGLGHQEFFQHWYEVHGELASKLPGLRRYVQNHAVLELFGRRPMTHDGWAELWFDDLESLRSAVASPQWQKLREDGRTLFAYPMQVIVARELIQKDLDFQLSDFGVGSMSLDDIRARLDSQGYHALLAGDPGAPAKIKAAAQKLLLGVWTENHIVTLDESAINVRPDSWRGVP